MKKEKITKEERAARNMQRMIQAFRDCLARWDAGERWEVHISTGNRKMGEVPSVSVLPLVTCSKCARETCGRGGCYALRMALFRENVRISWAKNTVLLVRDPQRFYRGLIAWLACNRPDSFRFNVGGDFGPVDYFDIAYSAADAFPDIEFLAFTKNYETVNQVIDDCGELPSNLHVVFSEWPGLAAYNPYDLPVSVVLEPGDALPEGVKLCGGNCFECRCHGVGCWVLKQGEKIAFYKH